MPASYSELLGIVREFVEQCGHKDVDLGFPALFPDAQLLSRARAAIAPTPPKNNPAIVHTHTSDACCSSRFTKAARDGKLDAVDSWHCPKCGTEWRKQIVDGIHNWTPVPDVVVFRP